MFALIFFFFFFIQSPCRHSSPQTKLKSAAFLLFGRPFFNRRRFVLLLNVIGKWAERSLPEFFPIQLKLFFLYILEVSTLVSIATADTPTVPPLGPGVHLASLPGDLFLPPLLDSTRTDAFNPQRRLSASTNHDARARVARCTPSTFLTFFI